MDELHAIDEEALDVVESKLFQLIQQYDVRSIKLFLERRGKERGSNQRFEATGHDGGPLKLASAPSPSRHECGARGSAATRKAEHLALRPQKPIAPTREPDDSENEGVVITNPLRPR